MNSPHNLESFDKKNSVGNDEQDVNGDGEQRKYSDDIVAELLREVGNSEKPFKLEDLARTSDVTPKKVHKEKKEHKKDKKKKKKKRKHEKHERSRSPESRKKHKKGRKHRSRSSSCEENLKNGPVQRKPLEAMKSKVMEEEDDDLPLCSDLKVAKETKLVINIKSVLNKKSNGVDKGNQAATKKDLPTESGSEAMDVDSPSRRIEKTESEEYGPLPPNISKDKESRNGKDSRTSKIIEKTVARINQKEGSKSKPKKNRSRSVSSSDSEKKEAHRSGRHKRERSRSRDRNSRSYKTRRSSRSRSKDRRKRSRSRSYDRRRSRRRYSKSRSRSRSKSRSDDRIDKARLLEIAQSKAQRIKSMDMLDPRSGVPKSIDDFVSYCEKLQKSQEQEERREKEGIVSSGSDTELEGFPARVKQAEPIKIKISNGNSALVVNNDRALGASVMFPVSSGNLHRDHIDLQWKRVDPSKTPLTCSVEQKKFLGTTSLEADKRKLTGQQKNPVLPLIPPPPLPPSSLLPPPPTPPVFAKNLCPPPPPMPSLLVLPESDDTIKLDSSAPSSDNIAQVVTQRLVALKALNENPNDYDARKTLNTADQQMALWANVKCLPGKFTGSTGVSVLSTEELQPSDPRFHAWAKKDMFKSAPPALSDVGLKLMCKMGWKPGEGLGRLKTGSIEPLFLDYKNDRRGLYADDEVKVKSQNKAPTKSNSSEMLNAKHPVSLVMELCAKNKWSTPDFFCEEFGPSNCRQFLWKAVVNGVEYKPDTTSRTKKDGKSLVCQLILQSLGILPPPSDSTSLPVSL